MERFVFVLLVFLCNSSFRFTDAYDPIDPNGNITINWDFQVLNIKDMSPYTVMVSIHNYQMYRHIEHPGWRLSWNWTGKEVIWNTVGAETTEQGDCSRIGAANARPHCCQRQPVMVDLPPGTPFNRQVANCCRGGVLSSLVQNNLTSTAAFQMVVGEFALAKDGGGGMEPEKPWHFDIGVPGYTCSNATTVAPTRVKVDKNRYEQVLLTWQVTCSYSQYRASGVPSCCVSMSTFYSDTIVACPRCTCACQGSPTSPQCVRQSHMDQPGMPALPASSDEEPAAPIVWCSEHMCPIRVHWHVKVNYRQYWRVKVTVSNYNLVKNYSDWNLMLQHPNLRSLTQLFSFNYKPLVEYGSFNDTGMFWGLRFYNEMLLQDGNVQTEMILEKESDFTYSGGWAFPRRVYFNGHECVMPPADQYPRLPNGASALRGSLIAGHCLLLLFFFVLV
ncbi:COBRA-like protein 7 [Miscanthus floridulus]|uniref:COBRA-like protein 7 n=1 Tax=Miscanthus floridulus TaxID=154761 RepID=UPI0034598239